MKKSRNHDRIGVQSKASQSRRRTRRNAEKIHKNTFRQQRIVIGQDTDCATRSQNFQDRPRRLILLDGSVSAQAAVMSDKRINARIVDGAHQKMERIAKKSLREGRQFPGAHVSGKEEDSFTARLRRREILESVQQHEALDILFRM